MFLKYDKGELLLSDNYQTYNWSDLLNVVMSLYSIISEVHVCQFFFYKSIRFCLLLTKVLSLSPPHLSSRNSLSPSVAFYKHHLFTVATNG
jgi:hypothetical protein